MPCYKCSNGKYKYGIHGKCSFDTLEQCRKAEIAINIGKGKKPKPDDDESGNDSDDRKKPKKKDCGCV